LKTDGAVKRVFSLFFFVATMTCTFRVAIISTVVESICAAVTRVTGLGEISPNGWLSTLGSFVKFQSGTNTFFRGKMYVCICALIFKKWIGQHFGPLFYKRIWSPWRWRSQIDEDCSSCAPMSSVFKEFILSTGWPDEVLKNSPKM
jgi:hypothetical protein